MSLINLSTVVHVCEDTTKNFDIGALLAGVGYTPRGNISIIDIAVTDNGNVVPAPTPLLTQVDADTISVTAGNKPNYFGEFALLTFSIDEGDGNQILLEVQVVIDPVNDAPSGEDKAIDLVDGSPYILTATDFGFKDVIESNGLKSVFISSLPLKGTLLLNGLAVAVGTDVSAADIQAGKLTYVPDANSSGNVEFGFQVRDDGGTVGCNASDLDLSPNYITFNVPYASLGDYVFNDDNRNGVQDNNETGVAGVTVTLRGAGADGTFGTSDDTTDVTQTDSTGLYQFDQLNAGKYQAEFSGIASDKTFTVANQGSDDSIDSDVNANGVSSVVSLLAGQTNTSLDAGLVTKLGSIGDYIFFDKQRDGIQNEGDLPFTQIKVTLTGAGADGTFGTGDDTTAIRFSDEVGFYQFDNLLAGKYQLQFTNPFADQLAFTSANAGTDDNLDSDVDPVTGLTQVIDLAAGQNVTNVDAGIVFRPASVGNFVFFDKNGNGIQDAGEAGAANVTVTLRGGGDNRILDNFGYFDDTEVTTTTDSNGFYQFTGLDRLTEYQITFSNLPTGYDFTGANVGGDDSIDSDAGADGKAPVFTVQPGEYKDTVDAGLVAKAGSIGDFVFVDKNGNGVQDADDTSVSGVTVTLTGAGVDGAFGTSDDTTRTTSTDNTGKYVFTNVAGAQDYQVTFSNTPAGYSFTTQGAGGNTALDSDANASGVTNVFTLAAGQSRTDIDAGLIEPTGAIGDLVFYDTNRDGLQDANDVGLSDITVTLAGAGQDGVFGTSDDISASTTTDASGKYLFDGLSAGKYQVTFSKSPFDSIADYTLTRAGTDGAIDSDADANGLTQEITLGVGEVNTTLDGGLVLKQASLGDFVFLDKNRNGLQDGDEAGVAGVSVSLTGAGSDATFGTADDYTASTVTDSNGKYTFTGLEPQQSYQVQFGALPAGYEFTAPVAGSDQAIDSDADASGLTQEYVLSAGENLTTVDAGIVAKKGSIGDFVFIDKNGNGVQDAGDVGVAGAKVTLTGAGLDGTFGTADDTTATATTNANGLYEFTDVTGDQDYKVSVSNTPAGYAFTAQGAGGNTALDSDVNTSGNTNTFRLGAGETKTDIDAGLVAQVGAIGDFVFIDKNANGLQDAGEVGVAGATVTLTGAGLDGTFGTADDTTATDTTDANGLYGFTNVAGDQDYKVTVSNTPAGYTFTTQGAGTDGGADSDVNIMGSTNAFRLNAGETKTDIDAGLVANAGSVGNFVFVDKNGNGVQDAGDVGVAGAKVTLTGAGLDGTFGTADDTTDTTTTDADGLYSFTNLAGDRDYKIAVSNTPADYTFTTQGAGGDRATDSDVNNAGVSNSFRLNAGESRTDIDAGLIAPKGAIGDTVFFDRNEDGLQQGTEGGVSGVTVTLTGAGVDGMLGTSDDTTTTTTTDSSGKYLFTELVAGQYQVGFSGIPSIADYTLANVGTDDGIDSDANPSTGLTQVVNLAEGQQDLTIDGGLILKRGAIGDFVFKDSNGNGIQDANEAGVAGVTVKLISNGFDGILGTADDVNLSTTTAADGKYSFNNLSTNQVYQVSFSGIPAGYEFTQAGAGTDAALDSNADANGVAAPIYLAPGETNTSIDAGVLPALGCIGDQVFFDNNNNGLQDTGDTGVAGVLVTLTGAGVDGLFGTGDDTNQTQTTDANGHYSFHNLVTEQDYQVQFSNTPAGYDFTTANVGSDDNVDSDANANGTTAIIRLDAGEDDYTIDAGLVARVGSIGDRVWHDVNGNGLQDGTEVGVDGITVKLTGAGTDGTLGTADDVVTTTTTSGGGHYLFTGLKAGAYTVAFSGISAGQAFTTKDAGGNTNEATDSDVDATGKTGVINLAAGQNNRDVDAGIFNLSKPNACVGDRVWFDEDKDGLQDACEVGVAGVTVKLIGAGADGVFGNADDITRTTTTDHNGCYNFSGLYSGQHYQIQFGTKTGYGFTTQNVGSNDHIDSDAAKSTGLTHVFTLADGECNTSIDAGLVCRPTASVGDRVWFDNDRDGLRDSVEHGAACVTVTLKGAGADGIWGSADDITRTTTTDSNGYYRFTGLAGEQQYQLQFGTLNGYTRTVANVGTNDAVDSDANVSTGLTQVFTLADGENNTSFDAGLVCRLTASVGDRVWNDANNNGIQDTGEAGLACVSVKLIGAGNDGIWGNGDDVCLTTTTDHNGCYKFSGLTGGQQYQLQFGTLNGYSRSAQDVGTDETKDSDANTSTGLTQVFTLADGEHNSKFDAGLYCKPTASVGDRVWVDCNGNGIQDTGDTVLACVTVKLTGAGADGIFGNADDITRTTTTDTNGCYKFSGLTGDQQYKLQFTAPVGYLFTGQDKGTNDTLDSDVNSAGMTNAFTLAAGQNETSIDAGLVKQVTACIVGATSLYEGCSASYQVKLSGAVSTDTWLTVAAIDGTAKRTGVDASVQNLTGVNAQTKDYALIGTDARIDADGVISVRVAAGQTSSASFSLTAWKENVSVDMFTFLLGGYKESAWENLRLNLSNSTNALVTIGSSDLHVSIGDTTSYSLSSPIALDMDGNGIQTTALIDSKGTFDLLGNGKAVNSGWLSSGDAFLAIDNNSNSKIDSISELFGGNKGDGFAKLASFDTNADGLVDANDADFGKLLVWQDLNGDHATDAGELRTLGEAGIASLNTGFTDGAIDQLGNILGETSLATRTDGTQIVTTDVYFNTDVDGASLPELSSLLSSTNALLDQAFGAATASAAPAANDAAVTADAETMRQLAALLEQQAVAA